MIRGLALVLALAGGPALGCEAGRDLAWPAGEWQSAAAPAGPALAAFEAAAFPAGAAEDDRSVPRTNGLLVVQAGRIVYERYAQGFGPGTPHVFWSASKSVLHAVLGVAAAEGLLDLDRPAAARSPWIGTGAKARITYRELLQMRSNLAFEESYEFAPLRSSVIAMLYTRGRADMARFAAGHDLAGEPGTRWAYKSGDSLILAAALRDLVGPVRYPDYPWTALFDPLGMTSAVWERDAAGTLVGSSWFYASPRDLARLGLLYARDGCWAGRRLLPAGWVEFARTVSPPLAGPRGQPWWVRLLGRGGVAYGAHWWLNRPDGEGQRPYAAAPKGMLVASGHWGQRLIILPEADLVIVRAADDRRGFASNDFLRTALAAFAPTAAP